MDFSIPAEWERQRRLGAQLWSESVDATGRDRSADYASNPRRRRDLVARIGAQGPARALLPVSQGGGGLSVQEAAAQLEALGEAAADPLLTLAVAAHGLLVTGALRELDTDSQHHLHLLDLVNGDRIGAVSLTEVDGLAAGAAGAVRARREPGGWVLQGTKPAVVNADLADLLLLTAVTDSGTASTGTASTGTSSRVPQLSSFLVDLTACGVQVLATGGPGAPWLGEVVLRGVRVDDDALLGTPGRALQELVPLLATLERSLLLAPWLGALRAVAAETVRAATTEQLFGRSRARSQSVRAALADIQSQLELLAGLVHRACWQLDTLAEVPRADGAAARLYLSQVVDDVLVLAARVQGPAGLRPQRALTRLRTAAALLPVFGGPDITRAVVAGALVGLG